MVNSGRFFFYYIAGAHGNLIISAYSIKVRHKTHLKVPYVCQALSLHCSGVLSFALFHLLQSSVG